MTHWQWVDSVGFNERSVALWIVFLIVFGFIV